MKNKSNLFATVLGTAIIGTLAFTTQQAGAATVLSLSFVQEVTLLTGYTGGGVLDTNSRTWDKMGSAGTSASGTYGSVTVDVPDFVDMTYNSGPTLNLFDGYVWSGSSNAGAEFIKLSGLNPTLSYDLAVYAAWGWSTVGNTYNVTDFNGTTANKTTTGEDTSSFVENNNYVVFSGLKPTTGGEIFLNLSGGGSNTTQWFVNGLELTSIPEPASALLGTLGLLALLRRRRNA